MIFILSEIDKRLFLYLNSLFYPPLNPFMQAISSQLIWLPFILLLFFIVKKENNKSNAWLFFFCLILVLIASDVTSSYILKNIFTRLRPCRNDELNLLIYKFGQKCGGKFGFVSSHAANSFAGVTFAIWSITNKRSWLYLFWLLPIGVSYSRIYLGVHYPGDILGGILVGISWGLFFSWVYKNSRVQA